MTCQDRLDPLIISKQTQQEYGARYSKTFYVQQNNIKREHILAFSLKYLHGDLIFKGSKIMQSHKAYLEIFPRGSLSN